MKRRLALATGVLALVALSGCSTQQIADYAAEKPVLDLSSYFNGTLDAYGIFTVVMNCSWQGTDGVLDEDFTYSDGTRQKRVWRLKKLADGTYTGRADDVIGEAMGEARGNTFHWTYTMSLPVDGSVYNVEFDDWMYLMTDRIMLNKATMSKYGVRLGEVTLSFTKR